jgi:hypothetical protein
MWRAIVIQLSFNAFNGFAYFFQQGGQADHLFAVLPSVGLERADSPAVGVNLTLCHGKCAARAEGDADDGNNDGRWYAQIPEIHTAILHCEI